VDADLRRHDGVGAAHGSLAAAAGIRAIVSLVGAGPSSVSLPARSKQRRACRPASVAEAGIACGSIVTSPGN
jgi:hypothetical protein